MHKTKKRPNLKPKNWLFLENGLDDFRTGAPKSTIKLSNNKPDEQIGIQLAQPIILNNEINEQKRKQDREQYLGLNQKPNKVRTDFNETKLDKHKAYLSKQLPRSETKRNHIEEVETKLLAHPLALYPHLLNSLPNDLVQTVSRLLESDVGEANLSDKEVFGNENFRRSSMLYKDTSYNSLEKSKIHGHGVDNRLDIEVPIEEAHDHQEDLDHPEDHPNTTRTESKSELTDPLENFNLLNTRKTYKWLTKDEDKKKPVKTNRELQAEQSTKKLEEVTTEFANWSNALSDNTANVEPASIIGLFESGYESKPALTVPIQVYELNNLPTELRMTDMDNVQKSEKGEEHEHLDRDDGIKINEKNTYGKWYIRPQKWNYYFNNKEKDKHEIMLRC